MSNNIINLSHFIFCTYVGKQYTGIKSILWATFGQLKANFQEEEKIISSEVLYLYGWGGWIRTSGTRYQKTVEPLIMFIMSIKIRDLRYHLYHVLSVFSVIWALFGHCF